MCVCDVCMTCVRVSGDEIVHFMKPTNDDVICVLLTYAVPIAEPF